ncbi:deaminase domain-containing protein [Streptomyces sp. SD15]
MVLVATSGREARKGMVPSPLDAVGGYPQRYVPVGRASDSEQKIFNYLADKLGPPNDYASGTIGLHSQRVMCDSCDGVMRSFQSDYPNIRIVVTEG